MRSITLSAVLSLACAAAHADTTVLHAARLLDVDSGKLITPGEVLVSGERIVAVGSHVDHPNDAT